MSSWRPRGGGDGGDGGGFGDHQHLRVIDHECVSVRELTLLRGDARGRVRIVRQHSGVGSKIIHVSRSAGRGDDRRGAVVIRDVAPK